MFILKKFNDFQFPIGAAITAVLDLFNFPVISLPNRFIIDLCHSLTYYCAYV